MSAIAAGIESQVAGARCTVRVIGALDTRPDTVNLGARRIGILAIGTLRRYVATANAVVTDEFSAQVSAVSRGTALLALAIAEIGFGGVGTLLRDADIAFAFLTIGAVGIRSALATAAGVVAGIGSITFATGTGAGFAITTRNSAGDTQLHRNRIDLGACTVGGASVVRTYRGAVLLVLIAAIAFHTVPILLTSGTFTTSVHASARLLIAGLTGRATGSEAVAFAIECHRDALFAFVTQGITHPPGGAFVVGFAVAETKCSATQRIAFIVAAI